MGIQIHDGAGACTDCGAPVIQGARYRYSPPDCCEAHTEDAWHRCACCGEWWSESELVWGQGFEVAYCSEDCREKIEGTDCEHGAPWGYCEFPADECAGSTERSGFDPADRYGVAL